MTVATRPVSDSRGHDRDEDGRIPRVDVEQQNVHRAGQGERCGEPETDADAQLDDALAQDHLQHVRGAGTDRHPYADLLGAAGHRKGDDRVQADRGQEQRDPAEDHEEGPETE